MLEVKHLAVNYRGVSAVEDVSFSLEPGQLVGVIGPNGAGKSTMVKAILGLIPAECGVVRYRDLSLKEQLRQVAYVPQRTQIDWDYPISDSFWVNCCYHPDHHCQYASSGRSIGCFAADWPWHHGLFIS